MPQKCFNKPNRKDPRRWTAKNAAKAVCYAMKAGATASEVRLELRECIECSEDRRRSQQQQQALQALVASENTFALADAALAGIELVARSLGLLARFVPQTRVVGAALLNAERAVRVVRADIVVRRAANDAVIRVLRQAA